MRRKNEKHHESKIVNNESRDRTLSKLLGIYIIVCAVVSGSWAIGHFQCSFLWVFMLISGLFVLWKTKLTNIVQTCLYNEEIRIHRKRALRQSETAEWLNFIVNRWWVFNADTIEELIKKRLEDRLYSVKPSYIDQIKLDVFTFGDHTPTVKYIRTFEYADGVPGGRKPVSWVNINTPPTGLDKVSSYQIVCEVETQNLLDQFQMIFAASVGKGRASLWFNIAVEQLRISGNLQIVLHMSKDIPFPHISKASLSFIEKPEVYFNLNVLKALNLTELPMLKIWIYDQVMDGLSKAMVDPGQINIPFAKPGAIQMTNSADIKPQRMAQGVLTVHVIGSSVRNGDTEDVRYSTFRLGEQKRTTNDELAINDWDDIYSFFVYKLKKDKLIIKSKCHRLLSNVTLEQHEVDLSSLPLELHENLNTKIENKDGSTYELRMQYTSLPQIELDKLNKEIQPFEHKSGVLYICVHGASNLIASDRGGSSDPYCVVFCDRRRVLTTPFIKKTLFPRWDSSVEVFVKDFTAVTLSFYVFDWDGTNIIDDDFLGSAFCSMSEDEPQLVKKTMTLGYNRSSDGYVTDSSFGQIIVSMVFRPVASVAKSEKYRVASVSDGGGKKDYLYNEDLVSPSSAPTTRSSFHRQGGGPNHPTSKKLSLAHVLPVNKTMVDLTILQGRDLVAMDRNGFSDPFCIVKMGEKRLLKTKVQKKTLFPKWNESTTFEVSDENQMIEIMVYDKDLISNDFLGKVMLSLDKLKEISFKNSPEWIKLQRTKSGMIQIRCTVTSNDVVMQREPSADRSPEFDVFTQDHLSTVHSVADKARDESGQKVGMRKDMKPDILPHVDEAEPHHKEETMIAVKKETKLSSQPPPKSEPPVKIETDIDKPSPVAQNTALNNVSPKTDKSPDVVMRRSHRERSTPENVKKEDETKLRENLSPPRSQNRGRSVSQQLESSMVSSVQENGHHHKYVRHSLKTSSEALHDDEHLSPVDAYRLSPPTVQRGRRARSGSDASPLNRTQSDMAVNNNPGHRSLVIPDSDGLKRGDSLNSFTYRDHEDSSVAPSSHEPSIISEDKSESGSSVNQEKMYSITGEVKEVRGLPNNVTNFYCKIRLQNPHTRFRFGSNSRVIGKSGIIKADKPVFSTKFEVDRGAGTSVDSLVIFDIKDGRKQHISQHSFTIGLLFMDYKEGGVIKWLSLGHGTGVEVLVALQKGNPNPRMMKKRHNNSMRLPGERKFIN